MPTFLSSLFSSAPPGEKITRRKGKITAQLLEVSNAEGSNVGSTDVKRRQTRSGNLTHQPDPSMMLKNLLLSSRKEVVQVPLSERVRHWVNDFIFPGIPSHYTLRKKIQLLKSGSLVGAAWEILQLIITLLVCITYIVTTYAPSLSFVKASHTIDIIVTQLFLADYLLNYYLRPNWVYITEFHSIIDLIAMTPIYLSFGLGSQFVLLNFLRCLRILRVMRMFNTLSFIRTMNSVSRQILYLILAIFCILFLSAGVIQLLENETPNYMKPFACQFINANTKWVPSCSPDHLEISSPCDCDEKFCTSVYRPQDALGQPSAISCQILSFFDAFYFSVVTIATVGYGDIWPHTDYSKAFVVCLLVATVVLIPIIVSDLQQKLALRSRYRISFIPAHNENHVLLCGHVNSVIKLKMFLEEFYHPDRQATTITEYRVVILSSQEPSDELKLLLQGYDRRITYVLGSALNVDDLKRVRADSASCVFLLGNTEVSAQVSNKEDAGTVLRALSISNFNPNIDIMVQVLRAEDRRVLQDSDIDCILCMNEYRTSVQAKNIYCRGFSTLVENLFRSLESQSNEILELMVPWYKEYLHGASMELYFVLLADNFLRSMRYNFNGVAEAIMLEYDCIVLGYCNEFKTECIFNPKPGEIRQQSFKDNRDFFRTYKMAVILADDQQRADDITKGIADEETVQNIVIKLELEEENFPCRKSTGSFESARTNQYPTVATKPLVDPTSRQKPLMFRKQSSRKLNSHDSYFEVIEDSYAEESHPPTDSAHDSPFNPQNYIGHTTYRAPAVSNSSIASVEGVTKPAVHSTILGPPILKSPIYFGLQKAKLVRSSSTSETGQDGLSLATQNDSTFLQRGSASQTLSSAYKLKNHVIICVGSDNAYSFISKLRQPTVCCDDYHSILVVGERLPSKWDTIVGEYNDVFFLEGQLVSGSSFKKANINAAYAVVFLVSADTFPATSVDESADSLALIMFLKLQQNIPKHIAFSVGLMSPTSIAVLNATMLRRIRREEIEEALGVRRASVESQYQITRETVTQSSPAIKRRGSVMAGEGRFNHASDATISEVSNGPGVKVEANSLDSETVTRRGQRGSALIVPRSNLAEFVTGSNTVEDEAEKMQRLNYVQQEEKRYLTEKKIWETVDSHFIFPVFASAIAFVPSSFESLLVNSFFVKLTPTICEKLVGVQGDQLVLQREIPTQLIGKRFIDVFRLYVYRGALVIGLYRAPQKKRGASLPYVYTSPPSLTLTEPGDKLFVYGSHAAVITAESRAKSM